MHKLKSPMGDESRSCLPIPFFPVELISNIFLRLPVKSLLQFRCVSKSWKTLISDPQFSKDYLLTSIADPNMTRLQLASSIIINDECKIISCSLQSQIRNPLNPPDPLTSTMHQKFQIIGSCNGLLCLFDIDHGYFGLWNPSTRWSSKRFSTCNDVCIDSIITYHGFGYDHVNDKYKVLVVVKDFDNSIAQIFTFGTNSWTTIQNFPHHPSKWLGKFVSGTLNWIAKGRDYQWVIFSLDLGNETFGELLLPERDEDKICCPMLDALHDCLCFCYIDMKKNQCVVWLMKEYGVQESWTKFMMIPNIQRHYRWDYCFDSLCILENGILLKSSFSDLVMYYSNDGKLVYPGTWGKVGSDLHIYHESLVSPNF